MRTLLLRAALVAALVGGAALPASAASLRARLLLSDGAPAGGWVVSVVGGTLAVPCAPDGSFTLEPAPAPPFRLVATGPNGELSAPIEVEALAPEPVELRLPAVVRDSVTVVSGVAPGIDLLPASAATVVSTEALEQRPPQRLVDVLESVAGASKLGEGADSVPALRGLARGRTLILVDGARVTAERRAGPSATFLDPSSLASLEVLRGPGSVVYGSDAFGGVLNAVTRDPEPDRAVRFGIEGSAGGQDQRSARLGASLPAGSGAFLLEAHATDADEAEAGGGEEIFNSSFRSAGGAVRYVRPLGPGRLRASLQVERVDDLGKAAVDSREIRAVYPREDSDRLVVNWLGTPAGAWDSTEVTAFYGDYRIVLDRDRAPTGSSTRRIDRSDTDARDASLRAVGGRAFAGGRLQLGLDATSRFGLRARVARTDFAADAETITASATSVAIDDATQTDAGLFATWTRALTERWTLAAGARGDRVETENRGGFYGDRSDSASALSGNLALSFAPVPGWSGTLQVARGFRVPTLSDRYFRGPSGRGFVIGNPDLEPETGLQVDLALRRTLGRTALALYGYRYEIDDLIERYREGDDFRFRNRGAARLEGLELEAQARLDERWSVEGGAAWAEGEADPPDDAGHSGAPIDDQPAPNLFVGARYARQWGYLFARVAAHAEKDDPGPTELERAAYTVIDAGAGWRISEPIELRLTVRNLLDERYTGSPDETADLSPGRAIVIAISVEL